MNRRFTQFLAAIAVVLGGILAVRPRRRRPEHDRLVPTAVGLVRRNPVRMGLAVLAVAVAATIIGSPATTAQEDDGEGQNEVTGLKTIVCHFAGCGGEVRLCATITGTLSADVGPLDAGAEVTFHCYEG